MPSPVPPPVPRDAAAPDPTGLDPLLTASIAPTRPGPSPWRTTSLLFPALLGGPVALGILGVLQARRLGASTSERMGVLATALGALGALTTYLALQANGSIDVPITTRVAIAVAGGVGFIVVHRLLGRTTRLFELRAADPSSLWVVGTLAVVGGILVNAVIASLLVGGVG